MSNKEKKELPKCRSMMYTQQLDKLQSMDWKEEISRIVTETKPLKWAGIIHDRDINDAGDSVAPHLHLMLYFKHARSPYSVAWEISGRKGKRLDSQVERLDFFKRPNNGYSYLVHRTTNAKDKYQYNPEEVFSNFNFPAKIAQITKSVERDKAIKDADLIKEYLDLLYDGDLTLEEIEMELTGSQYAKAAARLKAVAEKRQEFLTLEFIQRMKKEQAIKNVIYLYGKAGYGKTKLALRYAENLQNSYYISGSSRDPFQGYQNQETVIIDELRPHTFRYDDLLKILDPYNFEVMIPSRYYDKALTARTIFITSPFSPRQLYNAIFQEQSHDSFEQLERRLACVIWVDKDTLNEMTYSQDRMAYIPIDDHTSPNPFKDEIPTQNDNQSFNNFITTIQKKEDNHDKTETKQSI